jgi:tetratricopeptide (TPR) repeat protein
MKVKGQPKIKKNRKFESAVKKTVPNFVIFLVSVMMVFAQIPTDKNQKIQELIARAEREYGDQKYDSAIGDLSEAIKLNPYFYLPYFKRGNSFLAKGEDEPAITDFTKSNELDTNSGLNFVGLGMAYKHLNRLENSVDEFQKGLEVISSNEAVKSLIKSEINELDSQAVEKIINPRLDKMREKYTVLNDKVNKNNILINSKADDSKICQSLISEVFPALNEVKNALHQTFFIKQRDDKAGRTVAEYVKQFEDITENNEKYLNQQFILHKCENETLNKLSGEFDFFSSTATTDEKLNNKPLTEAEKAKQDDVFNQFIAETAIDEAKDLRTEGYYLQALKNLNEIIKNYPDNSEAYAVRADVLTAQNNFDLALNDANKAISLDPNNALAFLYRSTVYYQQKNKEKGDSDSLVAFDLANKSIAQNPKNAESYYIIGRIYRGVLKLDKSIANYTKAIEINPKFATVYQERGADYLLQSKYFEALADFNKIIEMFPKSIQAYKFRGIAFRKLGEFDKSMADLHQANLLDPTSENVKGFLSDYSKPETDAEIIARYNFFFHIYENAQNIATEKFDIIEKAIKSDADNSKICQSLPAFYEALINMEVDSLKLIFVNQHSDITELKEAITANQRIKGAIEILHTTTKNINEKKGCNLTIK